MEKLQQAISKNKTAVILGTAALAFGSAVYYFLTQGDSEAESTQSGEKGGMVSSPTYAQNKKGGVVSSPTYAQNKKGGMVTSPMYAQNKKGGVVGSPTYANKGAAATSFTAATASSSALTGSDSAYIAKARQIASKIRVEMVGRTYDMGTISQVLEQSIELAEKDFVEVTLSNRRERRERMQTDVAGYEKLVVEYNDEVENVLKKAQQAILEILSIPYEDFEESVIDFMEKGHYQEIYMFQAAIRQKIKEKIHATKELSIEKTKEIIRFQIEILNQQPELLKQLIQKLSSSQETVQLIPIIITNLLNDYIFNEFQVEEEDQMKVFARPDLASDPEIIMLLQEIEGAMFQLMMPYGAGMGF